MAGVRYTGPASLSFAVSSHSSTAEAKEDFEAHGFGKAPNIQLDMPGIGDQRVGTRGFSLNQVPGSVITLVRVGSLELTVQEFRSSSPAGDDDVATVLAVTRMFAERARQAQNGQLPTARTQL
ncbi:hypothetical protein J5Y04_18975 [Kitasatospora sp. RG8]|uniref:hypothetical protein n=1 Tax=Kitasatospora sp. RG8 TaxID=2820815 RepID=UPI001ADF0F61|nr:hypothetical protein [Kitasatospora sp. RG8]MBP0451613.1 hypothetical protein [Kitasatospora sp. RG8]